MIVIGVDVHKHSLTAGRGRRERAGAGRGDARGCRRRADALGARLGGERLWAVEDCQHVTRALEQRLLAAGEQLVRVPPKLTAALREPQLDRPRVGEERYRELKLLIVHRDDVVDERRRAQQRLRWHLQQLDSTLVIPAGALDRAAQLERVGRWLSRRQQSVQVRIARDLVTRCRSLTQAVLELERERARR